jgi:hypothetical protein
MKFARLLVLLAAVLSLMAVAVGSSAASTVDECTAQLSELRSHTLNAESAFANAKDFTGLVGKLDAASADLAAGKNADAVQKLADFEAKLGALATAPKPKVDPVIASALATETEAVIACIEAIGTT